MTKHYVYALMDPRTAAPFYVGKGVSDRRFQHFKSAPIDKRKNKDKLKVLKEIEAEGLRPQAIVMSWHETQAEAYAAEKAAIDRIGIDNLTNQNEGGAGKLVAGTKTLADEEPVKTKTLTPKQEKFCQCVVEGMNQSDAYRAAYDTANMKPASVNRNAKALVDDIKIASRITELRKPIEQKLEKTVEGQINRLDDMIDQAIATDQISAAMKGIELQSKLLDQFPATKRINENYNHMSIEERLQKGRENVVKLRAVK